MGPEVFGERPSVGHCQEYLSLASGREMFSGSCRPAKPHPHMPYSVPWTTYPECSRSNQSSEVSPQGMQCSWSSERLKVVELGTVGEQAQQQCRASRASIQPASQPAGQPCVQSSCLVHREGHTAILSFITPCVTQMSSVHSSKKKKKNS